MNPEQPTPNYQPNNVPRPQGLSPIEPSPPPKASKIVITIIIGVIAFLFIVAGVVLLITGENQEETNSDSSEAAPSQLGDSVQTRLDKIQTELQDLGGDTGTADPLVVTGVYRVEFDADNALTVPSDVYANFAEVDGYSEYDAINTVLENNNLTGTVQQDDEVTGKEVLYEDSVISCINYANAYYARVNCVSKEKLNSYKNQIDDVVLAVEDVLDIRLDATYVRFFENSDQSLLGAVVSGETDGGSVSSVYLVNSESLWEYRAQASRGSQDETPPKCGEFSEEELLLFNAVDKCTKETNER